MTVEAVRFRAGFTNISVFYNHSRLPERRSRRGGSPRLRYFNSQDSYGLTADCPTIFSQPWEVQDANWFQPLYTDNYSSSHLPHFRAFYLLLETTLPVSSSPSPCLPASGCPYRTSLSMQSMHVPADSHTLISTLLKHQLVLYIVPAMRWGKSLSEMLRE